MASGLYVILIWTILIAGLAIVLSMPSFFIDWQIKLFIGIIFAVGIVSTRVLLYDK